MAGVCFAGRRKRERSASDVALAVRRKLRAPGRRCAAEDRAEAATTIPDDLLRTLLSLLQGRDLFSATCVCKRWQRVVLGSRALWKGACVREFGSHLVTAAPPSDNWRLTYTALQAAQVRRTVVGLRAAVACYAEALERIDAERGKHAEWAWALRQSGIRLELTEAGPRGPPDYMQALDRHMLDLRDYARSERCATEAALRAAERKLQRMSSAVGHSVARRAPSSGVMRAIVASCEPALRFRRRPGQAGYNAWRYRGEYAQYEAVLAHPLPDGIWAAMKEAVNTQVPRERVPGPLRQFVIAGFTR